MNTLHVHYAGSPALDAIVGRLRLVLLAALVAGALLPGGGARRAIAGEDAAASHPPRAYVTGVQHAWQTWNNCGPATLTMSLSYWGWWGDQALAAKTLKPVPDDKNVSPSEMVDFVRREVPDVEAVYRHAGDLHLVKRLVAAGFPVILETGFTPPGYNWMGHYRLVVGYDDDEAAFLTYDSYQGINIVVPYDEADEVWRHFNRVYVVTYWADREEEVSALLGDDWDVDANAQRALQAARAEVEAAPDDAFAWFNLGTSHALNAEYEEAAAAYDEAFRIGLPWRMLWYQFGPFEAYLNTGRLDDVIRAVNRVFRYTSHVEEAHYYRGLVHLAREEREAAAAMFRTALEHNPNFERAQLALEELLDG